MILGECQLMYRYPLNEVLEADNIHRGEKISGKNVECPYFFSILKIVL